MLSLSGRNKPGLEVMFVVFVNTSAIDELEELPEELKASDLSVLLFSKH